LLNNALVYVNVNTQFKLSNGIKGIELEAYGLAKIKVCPGEANFSMTIDRSKRLDYVSIRSLRFVAWFEQSIIPGNSSKQLKKQTNIMKASSSRVLGNPGQVLCRPSVGPTPGAKRQKTRRRQDEMKEAPVRFTERSNDRHFIATLPYSARRRGCSRRSPEAGRRSRLRPRWRRDSSRRKGYPGRSRSPRNWPSGPYKWAPAAAGSRSVPSVAAAAAADPDSSRRSRRPSAKVASAAVVFKIYSVRVGEDWTAVASVMVAAVPVSEATGRGSGGVSNEAISK
jgi:hypothetical protein